MHRRTRRLLAGLLIAATALAPASAATAAGSTVDARPLATLTVGDLILEPTDRGYAGTLPTTVTSTAAEPGSLDLILIEPIAGSWQSALNGEACLWFTTTDGRRAWDCYIGSFMPGETRDVTSTFKVLTATRPYAMSADAAEVYVIQGQTTASRVKRYSTTFRGTNGSLRKPKPYVQDTLSNATLSIGGSAVMVQQAGGYFLGRVPMTVQWKGDAAHYFVNIDAVLPAGWIVWDTDPASRFPCASGCPAPAPDGTTRLMQGEVVAFDLIVYAPEGTAPGSYGPMTASAVAYWDDGALADVSPADNEAVFTATIG